MQHTTAVSPTQEPIHPVCLPMGQAAVSNSTSSAGGVSGALFMSATPRTAKMRIHFYRLIGAAPVVLSTTHTFYANSFTMAGLETSIVHNRKGEILQRPLAGTRQTDQQHIGRQKQEGVSKAPLISLFLS